MKLLRFSAIRTGRLYTPRKYSHFCQRLSQPQGHSATGRIMSTKNSSDIGNRTRDLPSCSALLNHLRHCVPSCEQSAYIKFSGYRAHPSPPRRVTQDLICVYFHINQLCLIFVLSIISPINS